MPFPLRRALALLALLGSLTGCHPAPRPTPAGEAAPRRVQVAGTWLALGPDASSPDPLAPALAAATGRCARPPPGFPAEGVSGSAPLLAPGGDAVIVSAASARARDAAAHAELAALTTYRAPRWSEPTGAVVPIPSQNGAFQTSLRDDALWALGTLPGAAPQKGCPPEAETRLLLVAPGGERVDLGEVDCRPPAPELVALPGGHALVALRTPGRSEPAYLRVDPDGERLPLPVPPGAAQLALRPDGETLLFVRGRYVLEAPLSAPDHPRVRYDLARLPAREGGYRVAPAGPRDLLLAAGNRLARIDAQDGLTWIAELPEAAGPARLSFGALSASADGATVAAAVLATSEQQSLSRVRLFQCSP